MKVGSREVEGVGVWTISTAVVLATSDELTTEMAPVSDGEMVVLSAVAVVNTEIEPIAQQ